uniref:TPH domain-containing protein n=1 Tax=Schistosoma curassoni TaxID=6186 RepID=A0A183JG80_9TREM
LAFLNDSKQQICVLGCNLCDSEEKRSLFHNQNNEWACNHENQSANHPRQQDQNSKSDRLNKQINELTERESYKIKWVEKRNEYESEIKELRRAKEKATQKNIKYEEQITELKNKLSSKQEQIHNLLIELEQSNQRLNVIETQFNAYKLQTSQNEENYKTLSREFVIMKQCKEQAELNAKNCENNRLLYERRMKELDDKGFPICLDMICPYTIHCSVSEFQHSFIRCYEQSKQRYYDDIKGLMNQLDMERSRADELLQKIEHNRRQNEEQLKTIEQTQQKKLDALLEDGQKELRKQLAEANEQIKEQQIIIFNQELKISTMDSDKNELIKINQKSTEEQSDLREQIKLIENLLTIKDQDISMMQFECRLYADKLKQTELEKNHFIEKERFIKQRYQNKAKRAWEQCQTTRTRLSRRLVHLRYNRDLLSKHLKKQYEQMNRLNNLFWETGWAYVQSQNSLQNINRQEKEYVDKEMQTILINNKIKQVRYVKLVKYMSPITIVKNQ